jgi:hypothetical protein
MSKHHYHAVIWIDHHEARVFHFSPTDVERLVLHPDNRPGTSITKQTQSGVGTHLRITTIFTQPLNQLQTPVRLSLQDQPMQRPTGQTHSPPRSQADERHRRSGNCRSSKRRATRRLCQKILQGDGSDAAAEGVGDWRNALHFCLGAGSGHNSGMIVRSSIHE